MAIKKPIVAVSETDPRIFEQKSERIVNDGYKVLSTSCGFVNSADYDYCEVYQAIFILK